MNPRLIALLALAACATDEPPAATPTSAVQINELLASNATGIHEGGAYADWIELYNPGPDPVSLDYWSLGEPGGERHPLALGVEIPAGGHHLLFADGTQDQDHIGLRLNRDGEALALYDPNGVEIDRIAWGPQLADHSLARTPDGGPDWQIRAEPTPGAANGGEPEGTELSDATCTPAVDGETNVLEGEPITLVARCPQGGDWRIDWFGPAPQVDRATVTLPTSLDDAGTYALFVSFKPRGVASVPTTALVEVSVADDWTSDANIPVSPTDYVSEWGLPVLHLDIDPLAVTQDYQPTRAWLDGVEYTCALKIRGAASAGYPKNNFTLECDPVQLALGPYGLQNKDHVVLVSNFDDNSHVRQRLVYDSWAAIAEFWGEPRLTPRSAPIVVYMNGGYHGLYVALDHVDDEFLREMGLVDGGDLFKSVDHNANFYLHDTGGAPKAQLWAGWEKKEGFDLLDMAAIEELTGWSGGADHATFEAEIDDWVDRDEFMDWFHLVFTLAAEDSAGKNAYLYVDPTTGLYRYIPWDFNHATGQSWRTERQPSDVMNMYVWNNAFFWHFQDHPPLAAVHWERLRQMREPGGPLALDTLLATLDRYDAELERHPERDWERWEADYLVYGLWSWRTDWTTPAEERAWVEQWLIERDALLSTF